MAQVHCPHEKESHDYTAVDHVKLFRNLPTLRFEGRVHEQILPAINRLGGEVGWTDIFVLHSGSDHSAEGQAKKLARDLRILQLEDTERPDHPFTLFNLGMTHLEMKHFEEAADYLARTITVAGPHESHVPKAFSLLVQSLSESGKTDMANQRCEEGLSRYPDDPELLFRAGVLAQHGRRPLDAERYYRQILEGKFDRWFRSLDQGILGYKTHQNLASLYGDEGRPREAEQQWRLIVAKRPDYDAAWIGLVTCLLKQGKVAEARRLLRSNEFMKQRLAIQNRLEAQIEEAEGNIAGARPYSRSCCRRISG